MIKQKRNKGITLIALVITIVIMLILLTVASSYVLSGELFGQAKKAVDETNNKIATQDKFIKEIILKVKSMIISHKVVLVELMLKIL